MFFNPIRIRIFATSLIGQNFYQFKEFLFNRIPFQHSIIALVGAGQPASGHLRPTASLGLSWDK